ncbi:voltage-dependent calcium channel subunit alpha-2/delta-3 [Prorops nasuta]|uniref:voltage-dependent calcium channel subunit alpha-2/delta-3 n=1 Tax=Prorops nasuta TaxID=863751 RepID=UPI0034CE23AE
MRSNTAISCLIVVFATLGTSGFAKDAHIVGRWATTLGNELWELAQAVGRPDELLATYRSMNTRVEKKSGEELIKIIRESVGRMLRRKMDAVTCIRMYAEMDAEDWDPIVGMNKTFRYVSGKQSKFTADDDVPEPTPEPTPIIVYNFKQCSTNNSEIEMKNSTSSANKTEEYNPYWPIHLTTDTHFYNIPVNTNVSSVHIPTNVYDLLPEVKEDIARTETLDDIFRQNYESDPSLSWQYFGSVTGMLRQFPAMEWEPNNTIPGEVDLYDCRTRSWFIEAATCSKDMVILVDTSGSMTGMGKTIAKATIVSILDTLSNNDFVTILSYSNTTEEVFPCFKDMLVQATPENIDTFKKSLDSLKTDGLANLTEAFNRAFSLLKSYRDDRGCGDEGGCNQLIMLVTDGVPGNLTEVFKFWNWKENSTHIPVRVFTYLLGKEVTKVREIQWMACLNRGYYRHVHSQEEAREQVLKYISVVARPLVLQGKVHPVVWTHAYADVTNPALATWLWKVMKEKEQKYRLEKYLRGKELGVRINEDAVYIKQMDKDADVRMDPGSLNTTSWQEYRLLLSVGTPVFDRKGNRNNESRLANLLGVAGTDVPIDDIRKLTLPYKLGVNGYAFIVSNNGYVILHPDLRPVHRGRLKLNYNSVDLTEVEILDDGKGPRDPGEEVLELRSNLVDHNWGSMKGVPVKLHYDDNRRVTKERRDYFFAPLPGTPFGLAVALPNYGTTWIKVGDEISRNQKRRINVADYFLGDQWRIHPGWVYCRYHYLEGHEFEKPELELQHFLDKMNSPDWRWSDQYEAFPIDRNDSEDVNCGRQTLHHDDYYCNEELMQLLVFDAKATNTSFNGTFSLNNPRERILADTYQVFIRFVATQSGLTRWHHLNIEHPADENDGIVFGDLHRRAVNEPWYKGAIFQNNIDPESLCLTVPWEAGAEAVVTASLGVFPSDAGKKAAAAVIGFQMPMTALYNRFIDITSSSSNPALNCRNDWIDCYLLDQNGYIVISEAHNDTGQFMGTQEGSIMNSMVKQGLFNAAEIYDYQAWCEDIRIEGSASTLTEPFRYIGRVVMELLLRLLWFSSQLISLPGSLGRIYTDNDAPGPPPPPQEVIYNYPCDQKRTLYSMNQTIADKGVTNHSDYCSRPFFAQRVEHTNLLLVVVDALYPTCYKRLDVTPIEILPNQYNNNTYGRPCHKLPLNELKRRRLEGCFTEHPLEHEIKDCGRGSRLTVSSFLLFIVILKSL